MSARRKRPRSRGTSRDARDARAARTAHASRTSRTARAFRASRTARTTSPRASPPRSGPTFPQAQQRVDAWISQFEAGYWPPLSMLARLTEEVGELARELNHRYGHKPKKKSEPDGDIALEIADIIFVVICLSNSLGIDLEDAFERVLTKYDRRDGERWVRRRPQRRVGAAVGQPQESRARRPSPLPRAKKRRT